MGSKQDACYRVVVSDSRSVPTADFIESLGTYDPGATPSSVRLDLAKVDAWVAKGARPSSTVQSLINKSRREQSSAEA
jgi:small subunit ribosomal protein S16